MIFKQCYRKILIFFFSWCAALWDQVRPSIWQGHRLSRGRCCCHPRYSLDYEASINQLVCIFLHHRRIPWLRQKRAVILFRCQLQILSNPITALINYWSNNFCAVFIALLYRFTCILFHLQTYNLMNLKVKRTVVVLVFILQLCK